MCTAVLCYPTAPRLLEQASEQGGQPPPPADTTQEEYDDDDDDEDEETLETFLARQRAEKDAMGVVLTQSDGALLKAAGLEFVEGLKALSWHMHPAPLVSVL